MKTLRSFLLPVAFALVLAATPAFAKPGWMTDFKQAQEEAKTNHKLLLVDFTGSDWCGWCIRLDREIFSKPEFQEYAGKNLVLMEADFPRGKDIPAAVKVQNNDLAERYGIQGFPTIIVLDGSGKKLGMLGYMAGGPAAFIAELDLLRKE